MIQSQVIEDFKRIAEMHSEKLQSMLATCKCIYSVPATIFPDDSSREVLRKIMAQVCQEPLKRRGPSDANDIQLTELWISDAVAIALCDIHWPDGLCFTFAVTLLRTDAGEYDVSVGMPYIRPDQSFYCQAE
jgi:hypothetical protein